MRTVRTTQNGGSDGMETLSPVVGRLLGAINSHDAHAVAACFSADCKQDTPLHPSRDFTGSEQVYRNWSRLLADVPDLRAEILRWAVHGDEVWTEWDMSGTRQDGSRQVFRGVAVHEVSGDLIRSTRFYLEPVVDP